MEGFTTCNCGKNNIPKRYIRVVLKEGIKSENYGTLVESKEMYFDYDIHGVEITKVGTDAIVRIYKDNSNGTETIMIISLGNVLLIDYNYMSNIFCV